MFGYFYASSRRKHGEGFAWNNLFLSVAHSYYSHTQTYTDTHINTVTHTHKHTRRICTYPYLSLASRAKHTQHTRTGRESHTHTRTGSLQARTLSRWRCVCVTTMVLLEGGGSTGGLEGMECPRKKKDELLVKYYILGLSH